MRYRVVIDPGHGGSDPGKVVAGAKEAAIALRVGTLLVDELAERDVLCTLTRWDDVFVALSDRAAKANAAGADLFVSIHANANNGEEVSGAQSLYCNGSERGKSAAVTLQHALESIIPATKWSGALPDGSVHTGYTKVAAQYNAQLPKSLGWAERDRITRLRFKADTYRTLAVLRQTDMPAVLLELGFLTNEGDRAKLNNPVMQRAFASAIADAVVAWLDERDGVT